MEDILRQIISWCLAANVTAGIIVAYMSFKIRSGPLHEKILTFGVGLVVVHSFHALVVASFFADKAYLDWAAPYGLAYGPTLYFAMRTVQGNHRFNKKDYLLHATPFILYYLLYIVWISTSADKDILYVMIRYSLFNAIILSLLGYGAYSFYLYRNGTMKFKRVLDLLSTAGIMLVFTGFLLITVDSSSPRSHASFYVPRLMMYGIMTIVVFIVLDHKLRLLIYPEGTLNAGNTDEVMAVEPRAYAKSGLPEQALVIYEERLTAMVENERLFLDPSLSIDRLSESTKIPKHYLSQIFSLQMGKSFADYINQLRIRYACKELEQPRDISMEQLGYECGFNSKVSFYRNFKLHTGLTPSQYITKVRNS